MSHARDPIFFLLRTTRRPIPGVRACARSRTRHSEHAGSVVTYVSLSITGANLTGTEETSDNADGRAGAARENSTKPRSEGGNDRRVTACRAARRGEGRASARLSAVTLCRLPCSSDCTVPPENPIRPIPDGPARLSNLNMDLNGSAIRPFPLSPCYFRPVRRAQIQFRRRRRAHFCLLLAQPE